MSFKKIFRKKSLKSRDWLINMLLYWSKRKKKIKRWLMLRKRKCNCWRSERKNKKMYHLSRTLSNLEPLRKSTIWLSSWEKRGKKLTNQGTRVPWSESKSKNQTCIFPKKTFRVLTKRLKVKIFHKGNNILI